MNLFEPERVSLDSLTFVGSVYWATEDWSFNFTQVWKEARGRYFVATDSGCSCPAPFENINYTDETDGPYNKAELRAFLEREMQGQNGPQAEMHRDINTLLAQLT